LAAITVLVSVFNAEKYISRCLRSLLDQTLARSEYRILVVDDGSTDKTNEVLEPFLGEIELVTLENNIGLPSALNLGIVKSKSKYLVRVDADDYVSNEFLATLKSYFNYLPPCDAVSCDYLLVDDLEVIIRRVSAVTEPIACGIMFQRDQLMSLGLYNKEFKYLEEREMRFRFLQHYTIENIPLPLYRYRRHETNMTNNIEKLGEYQTKLNLIQKKSKGI
jgi:glycosyltransferase involved in cell wall biosynthesis